MESLDLARLTPEATPATLASWQRDHAVDDELAVHGRWFGPIPFETIAQGAGTEIVTSTEGLGRSEWTLRRAPTLADLVAPLLRVLVVGLNPSVVAAESGVPFGGATNRFWSAAKGGGLVLVDRNPWRAFTDAHVGFTDLVKRATPRADGLTRDARTFRSSFPARSWRRQAFQARARRTPRFSRKSWPMSSAWMWPTSR